MKLVRTENGNYWSPEAPLHTDGLPRLSVTDEECEILTKLASGKRVLEIGTGLGVSTRAIAKSARSVVTVDIEPWCIQQEFPANVEARPDMPSDLSTFDWVFIDGGHDYLEVMEDVRRTKPIPMLVLHDVYLSHVQQALDDAKLVIVEQYPTVCKLTVCRRSDEG